MKLNAWDRIERAGIVLLEWLAWIFLAFFVIFIIYAIIEGMVRGVI